MIADIEKLVSDFLRAHPAAGALGTRYVGKTPSQDTGGTTAPWVKVTRLNAPNATGAPVEHLIRYLVQLDVYAGEDVPGETHGQPEANQHATVIRAALHDDLPGQHGGAVVTAVRFTGDARLPDSAFQPPRERVVLSAQIWAH